MTERWVEEVAPIRRRTTTTRSTKWVAMWDQFLIQNRRLAAAVYLGTVRIRIAIDVSISNMINRLTYITYSILIIIFFMRVWLSGNALPRLSINEVTLRRTSSSVSTVMGDSPRASKPFRYLIATKVDSAMWAAWDSKMSTVSAFRLSINNKKAQLTQREARDSLGI